MRKANLLAGAVVAGLLAAPGLADPAAAAPDPRIIQIAVGNGDLFYSPRNIQILLSDLGYNVGVPDGAIGAKTKTAIRAFQTDAGLPQSGEPSRGLFDALKKEWNKQFGGTAQAAVQPAPAATISTNANAELIMNTQQELADRGYAVTVNGQLDTATKAAISQYQRNAGLTVTGQVSQSLLDKLSAAPAGGGTARLTPQEVMKLQAAFNDLGYNVGREDGVPGPRLTEAIKTYQTREGLTVTGQADAALLQRITANASGGTGSESGKPGWLVRRTEEELKRLGYAVGPIDATLDVQTRAAIQAYEREKNLTVTGEPTRDLLSTLRADTGTAAAGTATATATAAATTQFMEVEQLLQGAGYSVGTVDGRIDATARAAIQQYEKDWGLPVTTDANSALLTHLQQTTATTVATADLKEIETLLNKKGYRVGTIDGRFDGQTSAAIGTYQRHAGLTATGRADAELLQSLRTSKVTASKGQAMDIGAGLLQGILNQGSQ